MVNRTARTLLMTLGATLEAAEVPLSAIRIRALLITVVIDAVQGAVI